MERFEDKVKKALAKRLKQARRAAGFKHARQFAEALNVPEHRYRTWERGDHTPDLATLTRICRLLKVRPDEMLPLALIPLKSDSPSPTTARNAA